MLRRYQLLFALVINALLLWSSHASPDLLPYTEEAINNGSDPYLPWDDAWSTEYNFFGNENVWPITIVRALGVALAALGLFFVYLKITNAKVMILPNRCVCDHCHATAGLPDFGRRTVVLSAATPVPTRCCMTSRFGLTMCVIAWLCC